MKKITLAFIAVLSLACSLLDSLEGVSGFATGTPLPSPIPTGTTAAQICTVTATHLNLREVHGTTARVLAVLDYGEIVTILSDPAQGNWIHVNARGVDGWINQTYCKKEMR